MHDWEICFWQNLLEWQLHHLLIVSIPQCKSRSMDNSDAWEARLSWRSAFARRPHQIVASTVPSAFVSQMHSIFGLLQASFASLHIFVPSTWLGAVLEARYGAGYSLSVGITGRLLKYFESNHGNLSGVTSTAVCITRLRSGSLPAMAAHLKLHSSE